VDLYSAFIEVPYTQGAVVRRSQKFSPRRRPPSRGRRTAKI